VEPVGDVANLDHLCHAPKAVACESHVQARFSSERGTARRLDPATGRLHVRMRPLAWPRTVARSIRLGATTIVDRGRPWSRPIVMMSSSIYPTLTRILAIFRDRGRGLTMISTSCPSCTFAFGHTGTASTCYLTPSSHPMGRVSLAPRRVEARCGE
jgi:hypothetical protein